MDEGQKQLREAVRRVHRQFPTGVTIVTTQHDGVPYGLAVNAFASVSLEPPIVLVCIAGTSATYPRLFRGDDLAVNILAYDQRDVVAGFARSGGEKFSGLDWREGDNGCPILGGVSAHLELHVERRLPVFTHTIFVSRVTHAEASDRPPLIYLGGRTFESTSLTRSE